MNYHRVQKIVLNLLWGYPTHYVYVKNLHNIDQRHFGTKIEWLKSNGKSFLQTHNSKMWFMKSMPFSKWNHFEWKIQNHLWVMSGIFLMRCFIVEKTTNISILVIWYEEWINRRPNKKNPLKSFGKVTFDNVYTQRRISKWRYNRNATEWIILVISIRIWLITVLSHRICIDEKKKPKW